MRRTLNTAEGSDRRLERRLVSIFILSTVFTDLIHQLQVRTGPTPPLPPDIINDERSFEFIV